MVSEGLLRFTTWIFVFLLPRSAFFMAAIILAHSILYSLFMFQGLEREFGKAKQSRAGLFV